MHGCLLPSKVLLWCSNKEKLNILMNVFNNFFIKCYCTVVTSEVILTLLEQFELRLSYNYFFL